MILEPWNTDAHPVCFITGSYDGRSDSPPKQWCLHTVMVLVERRRHRLLVDGGGEEPVEFVGVDL